MTLFSQRKGLKPVKSTLQVESMDSDLRIGLWNALDIHYWREVSFYRGIFYEETDPVMRELIKRLWLNYFKSPLDSLSHSWSEVYGHIRTYFFNCAWNEVYDFIEFVASAYPITSINERFMWYANTILEREVAAYRFVENRIVEITSKEEIAEVEQAAQAGDVMRPAALHIQRALGLLADRKSPDYRNSIKESISAVESACKMLTKQPKGGLADALKELNARVGLHPALEQAFLKLYGYTSDADGIRHALMDEPILGFEDAKFMLVACSAFVNYVVAKTAKIGGTV